MTVPEQQQSAEIVFTLNGREVKVVAEPHESLLETMRLQLGITSVKDGCRPQGQCGACVAIVNGHARVTCTMPTLEANGAKVVTLEGLDEAERTMLAQAFAVGAGGQCGFCVPGIALHVKDYVDHHPNPVRADLAKQLDTHLCRCGGYSGMLDAAKLFADARTGVALPELVRDGGVGKPVARWDAEEQVLGTRPYSSDFFRPDMLHGAVALSAHARAKVLRIDVERARAVPGVVAIVTAKDVPGDRWQGLLYKDWPVFVAEGEEVRCVGDVIAAVAAKTEGAAREAASRIDVTYEVLPAVLDPHDGIAPGAPRVNPAHDNLLSCTIVRRGDVEGGLAKSAHVAKGKFQTQRIEHLFLEPECAVAEPDETGGLRVWTQGQGIFDDRKQIASLLRLPEERVFVTLLPSGGAFGGKEDLLIQGQTALLAFVTRRPVRIALTREQSVRMHPKRHPIEIEYELGCDAEGRFTAARARLIGDSGAYASVGGKVLERAAGHACGPYKVGAVDVEARAVYTNNPPCGAMRGFGVCQVTFAMEQLIDELADRVGLDAWEMRFRNVIEIGDALTTGQRLKGGVGIRQTLLAVKPAYEKARAEGRAVGLSCGLKNSGIGNGVVEWGKVRLVVEPGGKVRLYNGYTEMGQGLSTVLAQIASEASGVPTSRIEARTDTTFQLACGQTTGSRATLFGGRASKSAGLKLRAALEAGATLESLAGEVFAADEIENETTAPEAKVAEVRTHTSYGFATQLVILDETGKLAKVVAAHDVGRVVNPQMCAGQIEGAVVMGLGYALTEELACENGMPVTSLMRDIGALRARDVPPIDVLFVESNDPAGPYGAKGVGEIGLVPTAAAVANAVRRFDGKRRTQLPMRDTPAAQAMHVAKAHPVHAHHGHRGHGTR